ncbi:hypothetical protein HUJ05_007465 [Dendroctonus ponderosae]|nr:hypothetical protein HUJ05_007465 [Dendroctonus ponderosae]
MFNCSVDQVRAYPPKVQDIDSGSRAAFPLGFGHSSQYIRQGVALVGDAAHRIHPLAGQGVNLGFGDVACNMDYLKGYESERQKHNVPTMLAVEALHRLYNTKFTPIVLLRSLGLQTTHALEPIKVSLVVLTSSVDSLDNTREPFTAMKNHCNEQVEGKRLVRKKWTYGNIDADN